MTQVIMYLARTEDLLFDPQSCKCEGQMKKTALLFAAAASALVLGAEVASAATTGTGIQAGFGTLNTALDALVKGAGGYLILILSVIVGGVTLALTGRWTYVIVSLAVGLFLGYGVTIIKSVAGITATTAMIEQLQTEQIAQIPAGFTTSKAH